MLQVAIIFEESGKRYVYPVELLKKTLKLSDEDIKKLEIAIKREINKEL